MTDRDEAAAVLAFWFGEPGSPEHGKSRAAWFRKDAAFDAEIRRRFLALHASAALGERDRWRGSPDTLLALVIVLDQFSRNLHRDDARAFSQDAAALAAAQEMIARGWDRERLPVERQFVYLPFEHAEDLALQDRVDRALHVPRGVSGNEGAHRVGGEAPRHHPALRALPAPQRGAGARIDARGGRFPEGAGVGLLGGGLAKRLGPEAVKDMRPHGVPLGNPRMIEFSVAPHARAAP